MIHLFWKGKNTIFTSIFNELPNVSSSPNKRCKLPINDLQNLQFAAIFCISCHKELYNNELDGHFYCGERMCWSNAVQQVIVLKPNVDEDDGFVALWKHQADPLGTVRSLAAR